MGCALIGVILSGCACPLPLASSGEVARVSAPVSCEGGAGERSGRTASLPASTSPADLAAVGYGETLSLAPDRLGPGQGKSAPFLIRQPPAGAASEARLLLLPMEFEADNGAANGNAFIVRLLPAYEGPRRFNWRIQHIDLITLADAPGGVPGSPGNPAPVPGERAFGLGDLVHVSFFTPESSSSLIWGVGGALGLPTATDDVLGSGKWSAGPALRLTYRKGPWNLGAMGAQRWSFAGKSSRADISQLMVRAALRRKLCGDWYLVSAPIITANWKASSGERWLVPLGGGLGRKVKLGGLKGAVSLQVYSNIIKPTGAPDWAVRLSLSSIIPLRN